MILLKVLLISVALGVLDIWRGIVMYCIKHGSIVTGFQSFFDEVNEIISDNAEHIALPEEYYGTFSILVFILTLVIGGWLSIIHLIKTVFKKVTKK